MRGFEEEKRGGHECRTSVRRNLQASRVHPLLDGHWRLTTKNPRRAIVVPPLCKRDDVTTQRPATGPASCRSLAGKRASARCRTSRRRRATIYDGLYTNRARTFDSREELAGAKQVSAVLQNLRNGTACPHLSVFIYVFYFWHTFYALVREIQVFRTSGQRV